MKTPFGLSQTVLESIAITAAGFPDIEAITRYGSRAKGNFRNGSDIDLCLYGDRLDLAAMNRFSLALDALYLPWTFDLSLFHRIKNEDLRAHILRVGSPVYQRSRESSGVYMVKVYSGSGSANLRINLLK